MDWIVRFRSHDAGNTLHELIIRTSVAGSDVELTGGPTPILTDEDTSDDLFHCLRSKTGNISLLSSVEGDLDGLMATSPTSHRVYLDDIFLGYLQTQTFDTPWKAHPYVVTIPFGSSLSLVANTAFERIYTTGGRPTGVSLLWLLDNLGSRYVNRYVIFPAGDRQGFLTTEISSLQLSPWNDGNLFHVSSLSGLFSVKDLSDVITLLCRRYFLSAHNVHYQGDGCLLFAKFDYDGDWLIYDVDEQDQSIVSGTGIAVQDFFDEFAVVGESHNRSLIEPLSRVGETYEWGDTVELEMGHSRYIQRMVPFYFLQPVGSELSSPMLLTSAPSSMLFVGVGLFGYSSDGESREEVIIVRPEGGSGAPSVGDELLTLRFFNYVSSSFLHLSFCKLEDALDDYSGLTNERAGMVRFKYGVKCNGLYWDDDNGEWSRSRVLYDGVCDDQGEWVSDTSYTPDDSSVFSPLELEFCYVNERSGCMIGSATASPHRYIDPYTEESTYRRVVSGPSGASNTQDVDASLGFPREGSLLPSYQCVVNQQSRIEVTVSLSRRVSWEDYVRRWTIGNDGYVYRLISVSESVRDYEQTLIFQGSKFI